jgi:hypothetical protein
MKKILFLTFLFLVAQSITLRAEQPIPSRHARIYHKGNFREHHENGGHSPFMLKGTKEKRDMEIQVNSSTGNVPRNAVMVYVYSSDMKDIIGPFFVNSGETLTVPVDDRDWGVYIESNDHVYVDVWSSDSSAT